MCGLCGIVGPVGVAGIDDLGAMTRALDHRGPDDCGTWRERFAGPGGDSWVGLGHTRLAVIDLSPLGHQPARSADGLATVAYNGEIYNFRELRKELRELGVRFHSECDTEVLVEGFRVWGTDVFGRLNGMFAAAIWDSEQRRLVLARDRLGIKPLHYRLDGERLTFASELGSLRRHRGFDPEIDRVALGTFLRSGFVHGPRTIYRNTWRVVPGEYVVWQAGRLTTHRYWDLTEDSEAPPGDYEAAVDRLEVLIGEAVERRLVADVPLGAFLSGGIDSSTVVALMQERSAQPVRSFSIGFRERSFDEAPHAREVARHLGTDHTELYVDRAQAVEVAHELPELFDEPFADSSAIPTVLLSRLTRRAVTVALSGDGGDELFAGYGHYRKLAQLMPLFRRSPHLRRLLAGAASLVPHPRLRHGLAHLCAESEADLAASLVAHFDSRDISAACGAEAGGVPPLFRQAFDGAPTDDPVRRFTFADARSYLPDDILTKVDRASMSVALEARVPLLDHEVVRYALSLPLEFLWREGQTKAPLRAVLLRRVPRELVDRPKMGFGIPISVLLERELREWTERYLDPGRLAEEGILDPAGAQRLVRAAQRHDAPPARLWFLLCFERWLARTHRGEGG